MGRVPITGKERVASQGLQAAGGAEIKPRPRLKSKLRPLVGVEPEQESDTDEAQSGQSQGIRKDSWPLEPAGSGCGVLSTPPDYGTPSKALLSGPQLPRR